MAAVGAVALDAVISTGVMAGRDHNTASTAKLPDCVGKHWCGCQAVIQPGVDALFSEGHSTNPGKFFGIVTGIIADGRLLGKVSRCKPSGHTLRGSADSEVIQTVTACTHNAAHTGSAKLQLAAKPAF